MAITVENSGACLTGGPRRKGEEKMVRIRITSGVLIDGEHKGPGERLSVNEGFAKWLFSSNKAVPVADEPEQPTKHEPEQPTTRAATAPKKPKKAKKKGK